MKAYGLGSAVNPLAVTCPKCTRAAGKPCARRAALKDVDSTAGLRFGNLGVKKGDWIGTSKRCHSERVSAAIKEKETK